MALTRRQSRILEQKEKRKVEQNSENNKDESMRNGEIETGSKLESPIKKDVLGANNYEPAEKEADNHNNQATEEIAESDDNQTAEEETESSAEEEEDSEEGESDNEQENDTDENESDEEDLDELLNNAQKALSKQKQFEEAEMQEDDAKRTLSIPKLDAGVNVYDQLYIKKNNGIARLVEESVVLADEDDNGSLKKRQVEVLKQSKDEKKTSRKERQQEREKTAGKGWFDMPKPELTPEMKRDLQILKMRHVIDRKRHYKKFGKGEEPKYFQTGTIIEGATEFFSSRVNRKDRKQTIVDELLADETARSYHKRKHLEAQSRGRNGRKKVKREMKRL